MKFEREIKSAFQERFGTSVFERAVVKDFLRPYFPKEFDPEKLVEQKENIFAQRFIQSFKDGDGVRDVIAFNDKKNDPEQISYSFITEETPARVLGRQKERLLRQVAGLLRTIEKIEAKEAELEKSKNQVEVDLNEAGELVLVQPVNS